MSVLIKRVTPGSPADKAGIKAGMRLIGIDGGEINDVIDYQFYGDADMGLEFETFLMDEKRGCKNNCVFCFVNQLPRGMRETLYFKDDDSRLSFLQGNYITLTNLSDRDAERIIKMKTPVNVSVHTVNPKLRVEMMRNPTAGKALDYLYRFAQSRISMNCQLVLCPGINDGEELTRSLEALNNMESVGSIACVPVGLTKHRVDLNLPELRGFDKSGAAAVINTAAGFDKAYPADEFFLLAELPMPDYDYYGGFPQYENGVGMWAYFKHGFKQALGAKRVSKTDLLKRRSRKISVATGTAAYPLIAESARLCGEKTGVDARVYAIRNDFFGESVNVSGLLTGGDIIAQLKGQDLGEELLIGANMLNADGLFLDGLTPFDLENALGVKIKAVSADGGEFYKAVAGA